jgi:outer membrane protein TolC
VAWRLLSVAPMNRFALLVAAVLAALADPATAQPRGRSQANTASARQPASDDGDGPEARGVALFKLDDIIEVAVRLSPDIARARADRDIAQASAGAARRDQSWILSAGASYQRDALGADTPDDRLAPLQQIATEKATGTLGLGRNLPTGGSVGIDLGLQHERREIFITGEALTQAAGMAQVDCGENIDIFCQDQASAKLTLKQPLARGIGTTVALAPQRKADLAAAQATVKAQLAAEQLIRDVVAAYWELAYAAYEVDVRTEALDIAKEQDQATRAEMRAGTAPPNAVDAVTYEIAIRDEALLVSKLAFEKKSLDLRRKAGLEIGRRDIVVRPGEPFEVDKQEWNVDEVLAKSRRLNRQLASVVLEKRIADVDVAVTNNAMLPQIDLNLSGALQGFGDTASGAFGGVTGGEGFSYSVMASLQFSYELSGAAKAANAAALARRHRLDVDRVDIERQIDAEVVSSVKVLISGRTRVALAEKAIAIAEDNVKAERAAFRAQRSNNFNVMQRQTQLIDARLRRGRAIADHHVAVVQLQYLAGTLLDTYRIHVRTRGREE